VLLEGLALASFHVLHDTCQEPVLREVLHYVMRDEARHVAFGNIALRGLYTELTEAERRHREEIVLAVSDMMFHRLQGRELYEAAGLDGDECDALGQQSELLGAFRRGIFSRIVPAIKKIGLLTPRVQASYAALGVLQFQDNRTTDEELLAAEE
jgi:hypothetical protein